MSGAGVDIKRTIRRSLVVEQSASTKTIVLKEFISSYVDAYQVGYLLGRSDAVAAFVRLDSTDPMLQKAAKVQSPLKVRRPPLFSLPVERYRIALDAYYNRYTAAREQSFEDPLLACMADEPRISCALAARKAGAR